MKSEKYNDTLEKNMILKLREVLSELPDFVRTYFRGIDQRTAMRTKLGYAYDLRIFFYYVVEIGRASCRERV